MIRNSVIPTSELETLSKEVECMMCLRTATDVRMCTRCSVVFCSKCIESWIHRDKSCPKCSQTSQSTDFVRCRLAEKIIELIELSKLNSCPTHSNDTPRIYCLTCQRYVCLECIVIDGQHINHAYKFIDDDHQQIITVNHKLIDFIRKRLKQNEEQLHALDLATEMLFLDHNESMTNVLIKEKEHLFDEYQRKKQVCGEVIKSDQLVLDEIARRVRESKRLSDQEEILQILQKHAPSNIQSRENAL